MYRNDPGRSDPFAAPILKAPDHANKAGASQAERPSSSLVCSDAVDAGGRLQAILLPKTHKASIVLNGEHADGTGSGIQGVQVAAVKAGTDVDVCAASGILANNAIANGSECSVTFDIEAREGRVVGLMYTPSGHTARSRPSRWPGRLWEEHL